MRLQLAKVGLVEHRALQIRWRLVVAKLDFFKVSHIGKRGFEVACVVRHNCIVALRTRTMRIEATVKLHNAASILVVDEWLIQATPATVLYHVTAQLAENFYVWPKQHQTSVVIVVLLILDHGDCARRQLPFKYPLDVTAKDIHISVHVQHGATGLDPEDINLAVHIPPVIVGEVCVCGVPVVYFKEFPASIRQELLVRIRHGPNDQAKPAELRRQLPKGYSKHDCPINVRLLVPASVDNDAIMLIASLTWRWNKPVETV